MFRSHLFILVSLILSSSVGARPCAQDSPVDDSSETPQRAYLVQDRFHEFGCILISEDDLTVTIEREGRTETYDKDKLIAIIRLLDLSEENSRLGVIYRRDGTMIEGTIIKDGFTEVVILIEGIHHRIPRLEVSHIELLPSFEETLAKARKEIDPDDVGMRMELARWMVQNERLKLAREELRDLLTRQVSPDASQLLELIDAKIELGETASEAPRPMRPKADRTAGLPRPTLTAEDVNTIRVFEIDFARPPKVKVTTETVDKLIETHSENDLIPSDPNGRDQLHSLPDIDLVKLIFEVKARELYPEIMVESEPHSLNHFRTKVHNAWMIRNCATSGCHGGPDAGRLFLHRSNLNGPRTVYENLLILERLELEGSRRLIDYENPQMSLLIQHALPRSESRIPHPDVRGFKPAFPSGGGRMQTQTIEFIRNMYSPRPQYPVEFVPPTQQAPLDTPPPPRITR